MPSGKKKKEVKNAQEAHQLSVATYYIRWAERNMWNNDCDIAYMNNAQGKLVAESHHGQEIKQKKKEACR